MGAGAIVVIAAHISRPRSPTCARIRSQTTDRALPTFASQSKAAELRALLQQCEDDSVVDGIDAETWRGIIEDNAAIANGPSRQARREMHMRIVASAGATSSGRSVELSAAAADMEAAWTAMSDAEKAYDDALHKRLAAAEAAETGGQSPTRGAQDGAARPKPLRKGLSHGVIVISVLGKLKKNKSKASASSLQNNGSAAGSPDGAVAEGRA